MTLKLVKFSLNIIVLFFILVLVFLFSQIILLFSVQRPVLTNAEKILVQPYVGLTSNQIRIIEVVSGHAWANHGSEVNAAFKTFGFKDSFRSFFIHKYCGEIKTNSC